MGTSDSRQLVICRGNKPGLQLASEADGAGESWGILLYLSRVSELS